MAELLSVRFSKVGYRDARLDGLSYNLSSVDGAPVNALIIGSNSSGKTSQLHLIFSIFLPHKHELASQKESSGRQFAYYFEEGEIGFVATEWTMPGNRNLPGMNGGRTRVVGRFSQFSNRERYENSTVFFSFIADNELGIDDLPISSSIPGRVSAYRRTISETKKYLREVFDDKPGREFYLTEGIGDWQAHLRRIGFNIEQFRLMMQFTMSEGDSSSFLKKFRDNEMVLEFLCQDVLDKGTTDRLHAMLSQHRESVRLEPVTRAQIAAYSALSDRFVMMKPTADDYAAAVNHRLRVTEALKMVVSRIAATLKAAENHLAGLKYDQADDQTEFKCQKIEYADYEAKLRGVREQIASLSCEEARVNHLECVARVNLTKRLHKAMQALFGRGRVEDTRFHAEELARQLDALAEPVRSLADDVAMAKALLFSYLSNDLEESENGLKAQRAAVIRVGEEKKRVDDLLREYSGTLGRKCQEKVILDNRESDRNASLEQLAAGKLLADISSSPSEAWSALSNSIVVAENRRTTVENSRSALRALLAGIQEQLKSCQAEEHRLKTAVQTAGEAIVKYTGEYSAMGLMPGIRALFEQSEPDLFLPALTSRIQERYEKESSEIGRIELEILKFSDQIAAIEGHGGLQPPANDVKRVLDALKPAGINAFSWWQIFEERNVPVDEAKRLLEAYPSRYGGVAVASKRELDRARDLLAGGCGVLAPVIVSIYTDSDSGAAFEGLAVFPDVALAIDRKRSAEFCEIKRGEIARYGAALLVIRQSRDDLLHAKEKLVGFLARYDETSRPALENALSLRQSELDACRQERSELYEQTRVAESDLAALDAELVATAGELQQLRRDHESIKAHIDTHETGSNDRIRRISELVGELSAVEAAIAGCESEIRKVRERESVAQELAAKGEARCLKIREELDRLTGEKISLTTEFISLAATAEAARALLAAKERALDAASIDAEYIRIKALSENAQKEFSKAASEWREKFGRVSEEEISEASAQIGGRGATEDDIEQMQFAREAALSEERLAFRTGEEATNRLNELKIIHSSQQVVLFGGDMAASRELERGFAADVEHFCKRISALNEAIELRKVAIASCSGRVNLLSNLASQEDVAPEPGAEPFATDTEAESGLKAARKAKTEGEERVRLIYDKLKRLSNDLAKLLDDPLCAPIPQVVMNIKDELRRCESVLTEGVDTLAEHIQFAMAPLSHELDTLEQKKNIVVTEVMHDVKKALTLLSNLEKKSRIPPLGGIWQIWTNRPFVRFWTSVKMDSEQSLLAIASTVTRLAQADGRLPSGAVIVQSALSELLGNAYRIETLKPDTSPSANYVGIGHPEGLHSWSGGQKLSGSVLFYMAMCNLLSFEGQSGGILLMDNPFGACNHIEFVRLIVALTGQYGIQMIAYTPTEDMEIRRLYPLNILIRKGGAAGIVKRTGQTLVQQEKSIYNDGEAVSLLIHREAPHAS